MYSNEKLGQNEDYGKSYFLTLFASKTYLLLLALCVINFIVPIFSSNALHLKIYRGNISINYLQITIPIILNRINANSVTIAETGFIPSDYNVRQTTPEDTRINRIRPGIIREVYLPLSRQPGRYARNLLKKCVYTPLSLFLFLLLGLCFRVGLLDPESFHRLGLFFRSLAEPTRIRQGCHEVCNRRNRARIRAIHGTLLFLPEKLAEVITFESIGHVNLQLNVAEQHRQCHREIRLSLQRNMSISSLKVIQR